MIPTRNQPNRQFEKILKISLRFTVTTNQSFWEIKVLGESSKICKDYLGRCDTVSIFEKQVGGVTTRI